jgi:glycine cleavage system aminomethyltransferase T
VSPRFGGTIALGYVRREIEPGGVVHLDTAERAAATVMSLPFIDPTEGSPR